VKLFERICLTHEEKDQLEVTALEAFAVGEVAAVDNSLSGQRLDFIGEIWLQNVVHFNVSVTWTSQRFVPQWKVLASLSFYRRKRISHSF
jgi:hypothetical protein